MEYFWTTKKLNGNKLFINTSRQYESLHYKLFWADAFWQVIWIFWSILLVSRPKILKLNRCWRPLASSADPLIISWLVTDHTYIYTYMVVKWQLKSDYALGASDEAYEASDYGPWPLNHIHKSTTSSQPQKPGSHFVEVAMLPKTYSGEVNLQQVTNHQYWSR